MIHIIPAEENHEEETPLPAQAIYGVSSEY
jgi:hypothetical protein